MGLASLACPHRSIKGKNTWLASDQLSLADLQLAPMAAYLLVADQGQEVSADAPRLHTWWNTITGRPSMKATRSGDMVG